MQATLDDFGPPLAFVRDLGSAMAKAVAACRTPPTLDLVCHFHFLAAVGGRLMDADHAALRHDELRGRAPLEPLTVAAGAALLESVAEQVGRHRRQLRRRVQAHRRPATGGGHCPEAIMLDYLDRYRDHLFGHPLARDEEGRVVAVVERTNNPAEHFFSQTKRELRRRLGRAHLGRDMQDTAGAGRSDRQPARSRPCQDRVRHSGRTAPGVRRPGASRTGHGPSALDRYARNSALRRRVSQWSKQSGNGTTPSQPASSSPL